jgi:serine/threonine-protein kinase
MPILKDGDVVRETYQVERLLGEGAFAEVYRVRHRFLGRQAMKIFKALTASAGDLERDLSEAIMLSSMRHPNIVELYDANVLTVDSMQHGYFTMLYMPGGTLERYWRSFGSKLMPVGEAVSAMRQICRGLAIAHSRNPPIVHRDIKPANILVSLSGEELHVKLSDFGLARTVHPVTMFASAKGTLGFKPPEAFDDMDSPASDVWAVGTTLYLTLTDEMPFPMLGGRTTQDATRFLRPIRPPKLYNAQVDGGLESIIYKCLAARRKDRYQTAAELLHDLEAWSPVEVARDESAGVFSSSSKSGIPPASEHDLHAEAASARDEALRLATDPRQLITAADLLEEAISKDPDLRLHYQNHLKLWRLGIMHASTSIRRSPKR